MLEQARVVHLEAHAVQASMPMLSKLTAAELCADCALAGDWATAYDYALQARCSAGEWSRPFVGQPSHETAALVRGGAADQAAEDVQLFAEHFSTNQRYRLAYLRSLAVLAGWHGETDQAIEHLQAYNNVVGRLYSTLSPSSHYTSPRRRPLAFRSSADLVRWL